MATSFKDDEEIMDFILSLFYSQGTYQHLDFYAVGTLLQDNEVHQWDAERLWRKLLTENWIILARKAPDLYRLSDKGMDLLRKHNSYSNFISYLKTKEGKKGNIERNDRRLKNVGILSTLGISLLTLFLTQYNRLQDQNQIRKLQTSPTMEAKLDSLLKVLSPNKADKELQSKEDTATNK